MGIVLRVTAGPHDGQVFLIDEPGSYVVGRAARTAFPLTQDFALSREHFQIEHTPPLSHLLDLGSTNGTKVNGLRVGRVLLREGDVISAGDSEFAVHISEPEGEAGSAGSMCGVRRSTGSRDFPDGPADGTYRGRGRDLDLMA